MSKKQEGNNKKLTVDFVKDPVVGRHTDLNGLTLVCKEKGRGAAVSTGPSMRLGLAHPLKSHSKRHG
jgi:hypothetical protein